jgi:hypothetical protein
LFNRFSLRFSLRALLVAVLLCGVLAGFVARCYHRGERQRQILMTANAAGAHIEYDFEHYKQSRWYAPARWLAPHVGADQVGNVFDLSFPSTDITRWRPIVASAAELQSIECFGACSEDLNANDLQQLAMFKQLKELRFDYVTRVPNLQPLATLQHLEQLTIHGSEGVNTANLTPLRSLPKLRVLSIAGTEATDEIIPLLTTFPQLAELHVDNTLITTAALAGLKHSPSLKRLHVDASQKGAAELLPGVEIVVE